MIIEPGRGTHLGATLVGPADAPEGVNFALFSAHAERVELCLFEGGRETRLTLPERSGEVWHGFVPGLGAGARYGYRVHGPWAPDLGHRFNPAKLLLDPYARALSAPLIWDPLMQGGVGTARPDRRDSAPVMPRAQVCAVEKLDWERPATAWSETIIYEAHPKGLTMGHPEVPAALRGRFEGLASEPILRHLRHLGVTTLELLPCAAFLDDRFLVEKGLRNYWGYQPVGFFAPDPRYGGPEAFRRMVRGLHGAGIEVIVDVVFNHSGEGDGAGPTVSLRGIDNAAYYRLAEGGRAYVNDTGTGNTLDLSHPFVLRMVMDCLRHWVEDLGVDGFRFDLAATLARDATGAFNARVSCFLAAIRQDPVLAQVKLIAEPWDIGPGGYQLGAFPHPFAEWNDRFRDGMRKFWRGDAGQMPEAARRLAGSAEVFDHSGRAPWASVNFLSAHDGFTLQDLVSYSEKQNQANGENNRDGHNANFSEALAEPGARGARKRAMLAALMLGQGVPMVLAGDEMGNTQSGNNNAYAQDNPLGWVDWGREPELVDFVARLARIRRAHPVLRQRRFLHANIRAQDGIRDLIWRLPSGQEPSPQDWHDPQARCLCAEIRGAAEGPEGGAAREAVFVIFNAGAAVEVALPEGRWTQILDSAAPDAPETACDAATACVAAQSVQLFTRPTAPQEQ